MPRRVLAPRLGRSAVAGLLGLGCAAAVATAPSPAEAREGGAAAGAGGDGAPGRLPIVRAASASIAREEETQRAGRLEPAEAHDTRDDRAFVAGEPAFMPPIVHEGTYLAVDHLGGVARPQIEGQPNAVVTSHRLLVEVPALRRRFYAGGAFGLYGASRDLVKTPASLLPGNLELFARYAWRIQGRNAVGAGLGAVLPVPGAAARDGRAQDLAVSLSPLDHLRVRPLVFGLRPMFDLRLTSAPFVLQLRQGLDLGFGASRGFEVSGVLAAHLGFELGRGFAATVEAAELVRLDRDVPDRRRIGLSLAPTFLWDTGPVTLAVGASFAAFSPFASDAKDVMGARLAAHFPLGAR